MNNPSATLHLETPLAIYRALSGPPGPKPRKNLKKVSRGLRPQAPPRVWKESGKSQEKVRKKSGKSLAKVSRKNFFPDFFQTLGGPRPREVFCCLFGGVSVPEGPRDPCTPVNLPRGNLKCDTPFQRAERISNMHQLRPPLCVTFCPLFPGGGKLRIHAGDSVKL